MLWGILKLNYNNGHVIVYLRVHFFPGAMHFFLGAFAPVAPQRLEPTTTNAPVYVDSNYGNNYGNWYSLYARCTI